MDKYVLRMFFYELLLLGWQYPGTIGNPVSWLLEQMCVFQDRFLRRIMGDYTNDYH